MVEKGVLYENPFLGECEVCIQIFLYVKLEGMVEIIFMQGLFIIVSIEGLSLSNSIGIVLLDCDCGKRLCLYYRTRVRSLAMLVTNSVRHSCLVNLMSGNDANCLMMSQQLKMPTQNLLRLLLLLMLMMRIVLATVCCRFGS